MNKEELKEQVEENPTELPPVEERNELENQEKSEPKEQTVNREEEIMSQDQSESDYAQFTPMKEKNKKREFDS